MNRSEKIQLTKEIKQVQEYISDMESQMKSQGDKFFFEFEGRKCPRYLLHGEFFFPSTVRKEREYLAELIDKRKQANK